jgi:pSer/pThr/pTyr-binding forkhead associated (FHA) protein
MEYIPIAGGALAFFGLVMMAVAAVMLARGNKRQVKVVIPTSTAGKMPPQAAKESPKAPPPAPPAAAPPKPEPPKEAPKAETPKPPVPAAPKPAPPKPEPPKPEPPKPPPAPPPPLPVPAKAGEPEPTADPKISEEGTRIAMIPPPEPVAPPPPAPPPEEATIAQPLPVPPKPEEPAEEPQSTVAISPGDMEDFRTVVEKAAPRSYGVLVGLSGGVEGRQVTVDEEGFVIGRDQRTAQLVISDPRISKRHVWIGVRDGEVWAIDVGSTNGTYLNLPKSDRITEVKLTPGDTLILAEDAARFEYRKD